MSSVKDTASFFTRGNSAQFEHVLALYPQVLKLKAENKCKKPDELIRLDDWYQNKLPQLIKKRGKDRHIVHEELVKTMKWKQTRGKFFPQLSYLIKVNTPRAVQAETRKAFRKLPNLEQAITALSNLKGVGTTMASALLAAAAPETAPFMADECLMAIPEIEGIDYTTREYMNFVRHIRVVTDRLNRECHPEAFTSDVTQEEPTSSAKRAGNGVGDSPNNDDEDGSSSSDGDSSSDAPVAKSKREQTTSTVLKPHERKWSPHKVELALWTHYVASELQPDLLESVPEEGNHTDEGEIPATSSINTDSNPAEDGSPTKASNGNASKSLAMTEGNHAIEEPSDESNCDGKSTLGSDDSPKDLKFGVDSLDDCTKSEDSMEHPSVATLSCSTRSPSVNARKISAESANARAAKESSDAVVDRTPKPSIDDERNNSTEEDESDDEPPSNKRTKFG